MEKHGSDALPLKILDYARKRLEPLKILDYARKRLE
jgi:hypothetical protein